MKKVLLLFACATLLSTVTFSQEKDSTHDLSIDPNNWAVSINGGSSQFYGDVSTNMYFYPYFPEDGSLSYALLATGEKHFSPYYGLRLRAGYVNFTSLGQGSSPKKIESDLLDIYIENKISLSNILFPDDYNKKWSSYFLLGYGIPFYRTLLKNEAGDVLDYEGYSDNGDTKESRVTASSISVGIGLRVQLSHRLAISAEANIESLNTDRLDATDNALSELDKYGYTSLGVVYTFGKNEKQVPMEYNPIPKEDLAMQEQLDSLGQVVAKLGDKVDGVDEKVDQIAERWEGPDADNDGISDSYDKEPNSEPGAVVNHNGVTINDYSDEIENMTSEPEVGTGNTPNSKIAFKSVYFGLNSTYITPDNMKKLANVAKIMKENKDVKFKVVGATCKLASDEYNKRLSERRAKAVKDKLIENFGIASDRIKIDYIGEEDPVAEEPLYINRRADLYMIK
ncbi:MAG: OmpA family protein [Bacteroidales bacterium]|nr:OmpA family protein [Bacteroidales bacterium]MCF8326699.1 OmpA family protein [Bacteroidales bacterium]